MGGEYGRKLVKSWKHVIYTEGRKKSFKIEWKDGHRSGMKIGGTNKGNLKERRERNRSRKRIKKRRNGMKGVY